MAMQANALPQKSANSDGYSDMPLNVRQKTAISVIEQWQPVANEHKKYVSTALTILTNVLYKPKELKFQTLRLSKPGVKKKIVDVNGGVKILKLAGFEQAISDSSESILRIAPPATIEEFEQLTDIWLILLKTQFNWGIHPDASAAKNGAALPSKFTVPNNLASQMATYFEQNEIAKSAQFQSFVQNSNNIQLSPTALERYTFFAKAVQLLIANDSHNFFDIDCQNGLNDMDASNVAAMIVSEICSGYYDEDEAYTNLILAEDLRIMAQHAGHQPNMAAYPQLQTDSNEEKTAAVDAEDEKSPAVPKEEEKEDNGGGVCTVFDIGCGWGNFGRLLMDKSLTAYLQQIEQESSEWKTVKIYGFDIAPDLIEICKQQKFDRFYEQLQAFDCQRDELTQYKDGSVDIIVSCNCMMQHKKIGHPNEAFLIEADRLLKDNGWMVITRRFHGIHLGLELYAYLMIAQQLGWKNVFASRIREIFYIG
eukprot:CAMPEP_0202728394 /NCGR_PEP_ID=MMETSP1385-20130828/185603_1 /ASSEMBLY_ACC=CAM_ASM_000861 /TAXON_ID=933848 /ORGANISM="Elphidium margaritaceum" /LENGTH=479 /DNA_ID=CAMNT_0049394641 /DNA_START=13 /DNA_END=1449 /DNA_ORIENTATION=-